MRIGFAGLGALGSAMARRLAEQGVTISVWNRTPEKAARLELPSAPTPSHLMTSSDAVFLNLFDSAAVEEVLTGNEGLLHGGSRGKIIVDTTTNHPDRAVFFHSIVRKAGASYLEAPVLGSVGPASQGTLTMVCSGDIRKLDDVRTVVEKLCRHVFHLEGEGTASRMKLVNNHVLGTLMAVLAEAAGAGVRSGIPLETVLEVLSVGAGNSPVLQGKRGKLLNGDFTTQFSVSAILKDLRYFEDVAAGIGMSSPLLKATEEIYRQAERNGIGGADFSIVYTLFQAR
jgi:3-hydroxyisobutyrate dehydrogenase